MYVPKEIMRLLLLGFAKNLSIIPRRTPKRYFRDSSRYALFPDFKPNASLYSRGKLSVEGAPNGNKFDWNSIVLQNDSFQYSDVSLGVISIFLWP